MLIEFVDSMIAASAAPAPAKVRPEPTADKEPEPTTIPAPELMPEPKVVPEPEPSEKSDRELAKSWHLGVLVEYEGIECSPVPSKKVDLKALNSAPLINLEESATHSTMPV